MPTLVGVPERRFQVPAEVDGSEGNGDSESSTFADIRVDRQNASVSLDDGSSKVQAQPQALFRPRTRRKALEQRRLNPHG